MPKTPNTRFAPGVIENASAPCPSEYESVSISRTEQIALTVILFLLLMASGFCLASLLGYIEMGWLL